MDDERIVVRVPNLFVKFLEDRPALNEHYNDVRRESEETVSKECEVSARVSRAITKCNWAYLAAIAAPDADRQRYRIICDWGNWIFPFDDLFDDGDLCDDYKRAKETMDDLLLAFDGKAETSSHLVARKSTLVRFHDAIFRFVQESAPENTSARYTKAMAEYCAGTLDQVRQVQDQSVPTIEEVLGMRRQSVGVSALLALVEYGQRLDIPDSVFEDPIVKEIENIGIDIILMHNDLLSYRKEESEQVSHNMVAVCRMQGMSGENAFSYVGSLVNHRLEVLDTAMHHLPLWEAKVAKEVDRYMQAIKNVIKANLYWSFKSGRFLDEERKTEWRTNGEIDILAAPRYFSRAACWKADKQTC